MVSECYKKAQVNGVDQMSELIETFDEVKSTKSMQKEYLVPLNTMCQLWGDTVILMIRQNVRTADPGNKDLYIDLSRSLLLSSICIS